MCVTVDVRSMGCGKSRHRSPDDSETDLKNSKHGGSQNAKKRKLEEKKSLEGEKEVTGKWSALSLSVAQVSNLFC
ncbi:hypothetical protein BgiBS90_020504 [Biomphalaria glabrata]|nr:hypothetical protein BgiBS90_020504 [Biomphalaria glabrata]